MSEAPEQISLLKSPLDETHRQHGASMVERGGRLVPASYGGDAAAEYASVRDGGAGLIDLSSRGRINVTGAEAVQFLNGLITNDVKTLEAGAWMHAAFPNVQGRLLASVRVLRRADGFLFDTEAATHETVLESLKRFTLAGDFRVADLTGESATLSVQGARAVEVIDTTFGGGASRVERGRIATIEWNNESLSVIRATHTGEDGFDLFVSAGQASPLWGALVAAGARPVGYDVLETLRIEAGLPRFGADMDATNIVLEAGLDDAVSFTKGCYVGQEIIARIHWRGHVAKKLAGLSFGDGQEVEPGDVLRTAEGKGVGRLTSVTSSPRLNRTVALAYVKYDYLTPGTELLVLSGGRERQARVAPLPFVRGSWFGAGPGAEAN